MLQLLHGTNNLCMQEKLTVEIILNQYILSGIPGTKCNIFVIGFSFDYIFICL